MTETSPPEEPVFFYVAENHGKLPAPAPYSAAVNSGFFEDTNEAWRKLIANPRRGSKDGPCVRGVKFYDHASAANKLNVERIYGLVLDLDEWGDSRPFTLDEIRSRLANHRFIIWTSYNSTLANPRYRLVVPLAKPIERKYHKALWTCLYKDFDEKLGAKQYNPDRLGYLPRLKDDTDARANYQWHIHDGPRLDAFARYGILTPEPDRADIPERFTVPPHAVDRSNWMTDAEALALARWTFRNHHKGVVPGARHHALFVAGCKLWWDFALEGSVVRELLHDINGHFASPKSAEEVECELEGTYARTLSDHAFPQTTRYGQKREQSAITFDSLKVLSQRLNRKHNSTARTWQTCKDLSYVSQKQAIFPTDSAPYQDIYARYSACVHAVLDGDPSTSFKSIVDTFLPSLGSQMSFSDDGRNNEPFMTTFLREMFDSWKGSQEQNQEAAKNVYETDRAQRIMKWTRNQRSRPYGYNEVAEIAKHFGWTVDMLRRHIIVQFQSTYYLLDDKTYSPPYYPESAASHRAIECLSLFDNENLFSDHVISLYEMDKQGKYAGRAMRNLMNDYGHVVADVVWDFRLQQTRIDPDTNVLHYACSPVVIDAREHKDVQEYLDLWGKDVVDWFAAFLDVSRPQRMLILSGGMNNGKTSFAQSVAKAYGRNATPLANDDDGRSTQFNDFTNPYFFYDEYLPTKYLYKAGMERLKEAIVRKAHKWNIKNQPLRNVLGYTRHLLATNDEDFETIFRFGDNLEDSSISAVLDRFLFASAPPNLRSYLDSVKKSRLEEWSEFAVAEHVHWLHKNHKIESTDRFGPMPRLEEVTHDGVRKTKHAEMVSSARTKIKMGAHGEELLAALYQAVYMQEMENQTLNIYELGVMKGEPVVLVSAAKLGEHYRLLKEYSGGLDMRMKANTVNALGRACSTVSQGVWRRRTTEKNPNPRRLHVIDAHFFVGWLEKKDYDEKALLNAFAVAKSQGRIVDCDRDGYVE